MPSDDDEPISRRIGEIPEWSNQKQGFDILVRALKSDALDKKLDSLISTVDVLAGVVNSLEGSVKSLESKVDTFDSEVAQPVKKFKAFCVKVVMYGIIAVILVAAGFSSQPVIKTWFTNEVKTLGKQMVK